MSISSKVLLPIVALLLIFVSLFIYTFAYFSSSKKVLERDLARINKVNDVSMQIAVLRQQSRLNVMNYRITRDQFYVTSDNHHQENTDMLLDEIRPLITTQTGKKLLQEYELGRDELNRDKDMLLNAVNSSDEETSERIFQTWQIRSENNYATLLDLINYNQRSYETANLFYENLMSRMFIYQILLAILMTILIILLYFYLRRTVTLPLEKLSLVAQNISEGNFKIQHSVHSKDEIGMLFGNLKVMSKKLEKHRKSLIANVKKKEIELKKMKEFEAQKDNFIVTASHELKTPVTSLKIFEQLLKKEITKNNHKQYATHLKKMDEQVDKLTRLIISLLEVAKMQVGKLPFNMTYFDLNKRIQEVVYVAQKRTKRHNIKIIGKIKNNVFGDEDRINQVIENLLSNAIKYSPNGKRIIIKTTSNRTHAVVSVRDYGLGIDKKHHKKIFNRFYRVDGNNENTFPGLGIGLYISTEIVKQHKGKLWVESSKGKGAVFSFTLPYKP